MTYPEIYSKLTYETAAIIFLKKNGEVRLMLGTRNLNTISLIYGFQGQTLGGHDTRCNINNGNVAVFDMIIGDARSFHIDRLLDIQFAGVINSKEEYDEVLKQFVKFKEEYEKTKPMQLDLNSFDNN
ncbi:MAG: DUF2693 domain-containing protein [Lachnospiraceae bacterium]|nr:DUF2693 domain-containing protein [Lachnospiraceae bacterium]